MENNYLYHDRILRKDYQNLDTFYEFLTEIVNKRKLNWDVKPIVGIGKMFYDRVVRFHNGNICKSATNHYWDEVMELRKENQLEELRRMLHGALTGIVKSQADSCVYVIDRNYGRIVNAKVKFDDDNVLTISTWGKMAKGSYEDKTLGDVKLGFKIHFGNKVFLKFNCANEDFVIYQKQ